MFDFGLKRSPIFNRYDYNQNWLILGLTYKNVKWAILKHLEAYEKNQGGLTEQQRYDTWCTDLNNMKLWKGKKPRQIGSCSNVELTNYLLRQEMIKKTGVKDNRVIYSYNPERNAQIQWLKDLLYKKSMDFDDICNNWDNHKLSRFCNKDKIPTRPRPRRLACLLESIPEIKQYRYRGNWTAWGHFPVN